jgi:hypothetical protein
MIQIRQNHAHFIISLRLYVVLLQRETFAKKAEVQFKIQTGLKA